MEAGSARDDRRPIAFLVGGAATAVVSVVLAGAAGGPYLALDELSPWLVTFAIGLFCALFATPFAIHQRLGGALEADARWERAVLWWAAVALGVLGAGRADAACRAASTPSTLGGAIALVAGHRGGSGARDAGRLAAQRLTAAAGLDRLD